MFHVLGTTLHKYVNQVIRNEVIFMVDLRKPKSIQDPMKLYILSKMESL